MIDNADFNYFVEVEFSSMVYNGINLNPYLCGNKDQPVLLSGINSISEIIADTTDYNCN